MDRPTVGYANADDLAARRNRTSPTVTFRSGADLPGLYSHNSSILDFNGGASRWLEADEATTVNFTAGALVGGGALRAYDHSTINFSGGGIQNTLTAKDYSLVNISGGTIDHGFSAFNQTIVNLSGEVVAYYAEDFISIHDEAGLNIFGSDLGPVLNDGNTLAGKHLLIQNGTGAHFTLHAAAVPAPSSVLVLLFGARPSVTLLRRRK